MDESVDGDDMGAGVGTVPVSPTFLPQAPKASTAASAAVVIAAVLIFGLNMRIPFDDKWISQTTAKQHVDLQTISKFICHPRFPHETETYAYVGERHLCAMP